MVDIEDWAFAQATYIRMHKKGIWFTMNDLNPSAIIQTVIGQIFRPASPVEVYSDERPVYFSKSVKKNDLLPIDKVYGSYFSEKREIKIFIKNIENHATQIFKCNVDELEIIIRLHEFAHALVHTGLYQAEDKLIIRNYPPKKNTDWKSFLDKRMKLYNKLDKSSHELLAQALTWYVLCKINKYPKQEILKEVFRKLMERQPEEYVLKNDILENLPFTNLASIFDHIRGEGLFPAPKGINIQGF